MSPLACVNPKYALGPGKFPVCREVRSVHVLSFGLYWCRRTVRQQINSEQAQKSRKLHTASKQQKGKDEDPPKALHEVSNSLNLPVANSNPLHSTSILS